MDASVRNEHEFSKVGRRLGEEMNNCNEARCVAKFYHDQGRYDSRFKLEAVGAILSARAGTALNPFRSLPYIRMYGKVSRSFFLVYIDHIVVAICRFVELQLRRDS